MRRLGLSTDDDGKHGPRLENPNRIDGMDSQMRKHDWNLLGRWFIATFLGWIIGIILAIVLSYAIVNLFYPEETNLIVGLVLGAVVGGAQVIAVRRALELTRRWISGAALGMGIPFIIAVVIGRAWFGGREASEMWLVPVGIVGGALAGLIQAPVLRRHTGRARWWILASVVSWGAAWLVSTAWGALGLLTGGLVLGAVSGALLVWLLRSSPTHEAFE